MAAGDILSLRLLDRAGRPITQWHSYQGIAGENPISIGPYLWGESLLRQGFTRFKSDLKNLHRNA
jgi:hypothetical protein